MILRSALAVALSVVCVGTSAAQAVDEKNAVVPTIKLEKEETHGWVLKSFDFGANDINFKTYVPATAKVETVEMKRFDPSSEIGSVRIVGKITLADVPVEATIKGYHLATPASALRVCAYEVETSGYAIRQIESVSHYSATRLFALQSEDSRVISGTFSQCYTRGDKVIAFHVVADLTEAANDEERQEIGRIARNVAGALFSNLEFNDGRPSGYGDSLQEIDLDIDQEQVALRIPNIWQVAINDFKGSLPAELHLLREKEGSGQNLVWLSAHEQKEKPDFQLVGPDIIRDYFVQQSPDVEAPTLLASTVEDDFKNAGIASRAFHFSVVDKNGEDGGDIIAHVVWQEKRLYVVSVWSRLSMGGPDAFFSRLPGLTAFDLIQAELLRILAKS